MQEKLTLLISADRKKIHKTACPTAKQEHFEIYKRSAFLHTKRVFTCARKRRMDRKSSRFLRYRQRFIGGSVQRDHRMKKIFLDANIIIDLLDGSSKDHSTAVDCLRIIRKHFGKAVVSPITFIIVNLFSGSL
jgi:hypothetical protein